MARLHAIVVVPATIVALASAAHGAAGARACQAVLLPVSCPSATTPAGENDRQAVAVELVAGLPHARIFTCGIYCLFKRAACKLFELKYYFKKTVC
jgi:hypothetical protein